MFNIINYEFCKILPQTICFFRKRINLDNSDLPTKSKPSQPMWEPNSYLEFTHTDFGKDIAQTTIPFIDSQPIENYPHVPLRGAGIYYKGNPWYGGFIAPSITAYDYSKHMEMNFPEPAKREDSLELIDVPMN